MKNVIKCSLITALIVTSGYTADAKDVKGMFSDAKVSGQIRLGYMNKKAAEAAEKNTKATAIGGQLKFETASLNGVSLGAAMYTSHAITALSGKQADGYFNEDLTSSEKKFTELAEAYVNLNYGALNFRAGRQLIDTPLADSDDIRMAPNTFEAYVATYTLKDLGLTLIGANVQKWQGFDAGYDNVTKNAWVNTGVDGTWMAAALYSNDTVELGAWYYDVTKAAQAVYADAAVSIDLGSGATLGLGVQYLTQSESDTAAGTPSGYDGSIAGAMIEASHMGLTIGLAYDKVSVDSGKEIFEGFGGGSSYTNMETMTAGTLHDTTHKDGSSYVVGLGYEFNGANIFAAYGDFKADAGTATKAHVTELDLGVEYVYNDGEVDFALYYVMGTDKESATATAFDDDHIQLTINYNF